MLRILMGKVNGMQKQICNESREKEILRKTKRYATDKKITISEIKHSFDGLINTRHYCKRISDLENISIESAKTEKQEKKD